MEGGIGMIALIIIGYLTGFVITLKFLKKKFPIYTDIIIWRCNSESPESSKLLASMKERYKQKDITNIRKILEL